MFPPGDIAALAASMRQVNADPASFRPGFPDRWPTWREHVDEVEQIYGRVIAEKPRKTA